MSHDRFRVPFGQTIEQPLQFEEADVPQGGALEALNHVPVDFKFANLKTQEVVDCGDSRGYLTQLLIVASPDWEIVTNDN
jgi:hypothetical protein